jgi:hypothetical protein
MRYLVPLLLVVVMATAACGHPLVPALTPRTAPATAAPHPGSGPLLGVDLYALSNYPAAEVRADGKRVLSYIRNVLKADAVGIVWTFFAARDSSDAVQAAGGTLSAGNVAILTRMAARYHLQVEYRPVIYVRGPGDNHWERLISPRRPARWLSSYYRAELPYLRTAQRLGVPEFAAESEMHGLNIGSLWASFFARAATVYHGVISYAAWDGDYFGTTPGTPVQAVAPLTHLPPAKYVGVDMYWPLHLRATATSAEVTAAWEALFGKAPSSVLRRTAIDETGIQARAGAYRDPPNLGLPGRPSEQVQANWFTAACTTVQRYHMRGVFFWKVDLTDNPAHPATSLSTFEGRKGAAAISGCSKILH